MLDKRKRFGSPNNKPPRAVLEIGDDMEAKWPVTQTQSTIFKYQAMSSEQAWSVKCPNVIIFDDIFVHNYVSSGMSIDPSFASSMYELAMGEQGKELQEKSFEISQKIVDLKGNVPKSLKRLQAEYGRILDKRLKPNLSIFRSYQRIVNDILKDLNASFRIKLTPRIETRRADCPYKIVIQGEEIRVVSRHVELPHPEIPEFYSTLSAADRNTLALALFFAYLDRDRNLKNKSIIIDDPVTSLDENRARITVEEVVLFATQAAQAIILSHDKRFLLRVFERAAREMDTHTLKVIRVGKSSKIVGWNTAEERVTDHDRYHEMLRRYELDGSGDRRQVAGAIRPTLEGFVRVAYPEHMPPGTLLGPFLKICHERLKNRRKDGVILNRSDVNELQRLVTFGNLFHHDTNPNYEVAEISDDELRGYIHRAIAFTRRPIRRQERSRTVKSRRWVKRNP